MLSPNSNQVRGLDRRERSPFSSPYSNIQASPIAARRASIEERRRAAARFDHGPSPGRTDAIEEEESEDEENEDGEHDHDDLEDEDEDHAGELSPLLPIFSAAHLDSLPIYNVTHSLRLLIVPRCETTLSWDQLRSPQVSQFLIKPIQQQIRESHFSKATLYALMANCLQFSKEVQTNPGNSGVSKTRALACELLAMKLLKEFSTRDLIDALSYDFDPLQGIAPAASGNTTPGPNWNTSAKSKAVAGPRAARISTLEVAIRAQSKRFLAHPVVVQQLEAIWAGTIVFHAAADSLHRAPMKITPNQNRGYGTQAGLGSVLQASPGELYPAKQRDHLQPTAFAVRRTVTLYDPREASLFKLSRLRVPRYRQFLSTCSLAVLLGLYVAVLIERSLSITPLEVIFWFWSAGFMLDEIVGFNEQGLTLYIMSFWNAFDAVILLLLLFYYSTRLIGILTPYDRKHSIADMAYDVLAADAVFLFPRLFSVLDHYRYFSQLLIAFRMMAEDLMAVFILIVIACSGFFVAFTLSFGDPNNYNPGGVAYALFQILMGYTPAAWESWPKYNILGKIILTFFLFICHFLIVTILITVLTNSFMAIVHNANEEHQFVFAVNTISMVKSDALFSYVAPTNILAWLVAPLRYIIPFRQFVKVNRMVIKTTHFPILFLIYAYERLILRRSLFVLADAVEERGRAGVTADGNEVAGPTLRVFSPQRNRLREPSVNTFRKDRALEEVFRRPFKDQTLRNTQRSESRRKTSNVVNGWMQDMGPTGMASPPAEQDPSIIDRLEARRIAHRRSQAIMRRRHPGQRRDITEATFSIASDPEDFGNDSIRLPPRLKREESSLPPMSINEPTQTEAGEGDDELATNDEDEVALTDYPTSPSVHRGNFDTNHREDYFQQTPRARTPLIHSPSPKARRQIASPSQNPSGPDKPAHARRHHLRNVSTNTILYDPRPQQSSQNTSQDGKGPNSRKSGPKGDGDSPPSAGRKTPKRNAGPAAARARPIMPPRTAFQSAPNLAGMLMLNPQQARQSSLALDLGSDIGDNKAIGGGFITGGVPASFATHMAWAQNAAKMDSHRRSVDTSSEDQQRMSKLVLARMNTLEEGFREVLKEVRQWKKDEKASPDNDNKPTDQSIKRATTEDQRSSGGGGGGAGQESIMDITDMKIGRKRSKNVPRKQPWKGKDKERATKNRGRDDNERAAAQLQEDLEVDAEAEADAEWKDLDDRDQPQGQGHDEDQGQGQGQGYGKESSSV